jgi:hypothetical protein
VTEHLGSILSESRLDKSMLQEIKEGSCHVVLDPYFASSMFSEERGRETQWYTLPDGKTIPTGTEAFRAPEPLFAPFLGLPSAVQRAIGAADRDVRSALWGDVVLVSFLEADGSGLMRFADWRLSDRWKHAPSRLFRASPAGPQAVGSTRCGSGGIERCGCKNGNVAWRIDAQRLEHVSRHVHPVQGVGRVRSCVAAAEVFGCLSLALLDLEFGGGTPPFRCAPSGSPRSSRSWVADRRLCNLNGVCNGH